MITRIRSLSRVDRLINLSLETRAVLHIVSRKYFREFSTLQCSAVESDPVRSDISFDQVQKGIDYERKSDIDVVIAKALAVNGENEVLQSLVHDPECNAIQVTNSLVSKLLHRFQDDWKSALGVFRWLETCSGYKPLPEMYDKLVDILGKMKEMDKMKVVLEEMRQNHLVSLNTIARVMRRYAGAGDWKGSIKTFDELESFGLEKNTESMNLLLDTLCKEHKVEQARDVFMKMKLHIPPNASTYNIFIHGWCKIKRVEEAQWTIQEMKGNGIQPCVISYSTIIQFYCSQRNFSRVDDLLEEMKVQGCPPNIVTFTTIMHTLTKSGDFKKALDIAERKKLAGCKPDTLFYNALIHTLAQANHVEEALYVFTKEMPQNKVNPNTSTYNTVIAMCCHHKQEQKALQYLKTLENSPYCKPDVQSFNPLLKLYFRSGKTDKSLSLLDDIIKKHHLCLDLATFTLLIHGLCKTNNCERAYWLFRDMIGQSIKPRYLTCSLLLRNIREKNMYDAAVMIEDYMKSMKSA